MLWIIIGVVALALAAFAFWPRNSARTEAIEQVGRERRDKRRAGGPLNGPRITRSPGAGFTG